MNIDLTDIPAEGEVIDPKPEGDDKETTTPADSSTETKDTEEAASSPAAEDKSDDTEEADNTENDNKVPFNKDPRIQSYIDKQVDRRLTDTLEEIKAGQNRMVDALTKEPEVEEPIPQWFTNLYSTGVPETDKVNWNAYKDAHEAEWAERKRAWTEEQQAQLDAQARELTEAEILLDSQVEEMKSEGKRFDGNALRKFMLDYHQEFGALPMKDGVIDMRKGLDLMNRLQGQVNQPKADARKEVAFKAGSEKEVVDPNSPDKPSISKRSWFDY